MQSRIKSLLNAGDYMIIISSVLFAVVTLFSPPDGDPEVARVKLYVIGFTYSLVGLRCIHIYMHYKRKYRKVK